MPNSPPSVLLAQSFAFISSLAAMSIPATQKRSCRKTMAAVERCVSGCWRDPCFAHAPVQQQQQEGLRLAFTAAASRLMWVAALTTFACAAAPAPTQGQSAAPPAPFIASTTPLPEAATRPAASSVDEPTQAEAGYVELDVPGFLPAVLYVPGPAVTPRPLVVAGHGAGGIPEGECDYWRQLTHGSAFLLCLRGARTDTRWPSGYYYPDHRALEREMLSALAAFDRHYPGAVDRSASVYAGFSQGAIMGAAMIPAHARSFPRLVLIEGGYEYWSPAQARRFARNGGQRVLFVCGTRWCATQAKAPRDWLLAAGVQARIEHAEGAGHTPGGRVMNVTAAALPWVLAGGRAWGPH